MKKTLSVILAVILSFSVITAAFADSEKCDCGVTPVIFVHGFAGENIYCGSETVFPPSGKAIVKSVPAILGALGSVMIKNYPAFGKCFSSAFTTLLGKMACDVNGNPLYNDVTIAPEPVQPDTHKTAHYAFVGSSVKPEGSGNFIFFYDWRLDPVEQAKKLHSFVVEVEALTGHDEVSLVFHSEGNTVGASYLALYGGEGLDKAVFLSPAFKGLSLIGAAFTKDIAVQGKSDELVEFLRGFIGGEKVGKILVPVLSFLDKTGILPRLINSLGKALEDQYDFLFSGCLKDIFGTLPGVWTFVPDEYYAEAKRNMFGGEEEKYAGLIEKLDNYHYNVQNKLDEIFAGALEDGANIVICCGYGISSIPITGEEEWQSDMLIDTKYMSAGATCAPYGETLGDGYTQKNTGCGHNHLSADGAVDASTGILPEYTWYFRGQDHNKFTAAYDEFLTWVLLFDGQPTVLSNPDYPQFLENAGGKLIAVK